MIHEISNIQGYKEMVESIYYVADNLCEAIRKKPTVENVWYGISDDVEITVIFKPHRIAFMSINQNILKENFRYIIKHLDSILVNLLIEQ